MENTFEMSKHAYKRCKQRGIRKEIVKLILDNADHILRAGKDYFAYLVTKRKLSNMMTRNLISPATAEKIQGVELIGNEEFIITVYHKRKRRRRDCKIR